MYVLIIIMSIILMLAPIIRVYLKGTDEEIERLWSVDLAGFSFKLIALGLFIWMVVSGIISLDDNNGENWKEVLSRIFFMIIFCLLIDGVGAIISKISSVDYELKKIRSSLERNSQSFSDNSDKTPSEGNIGFWVCTECGSKISLNSNHCVNCGKSRSVNSDKKSINVPPLPKIKIDSNGEWKCTQCGHKNKSSYISCKICGKYK